MTKKPKKIRNKADEFADEEEAIRAMGPLKKGSKWLLPNSSPQYVLHVLGTTPPSIVTGQKMIILESSIGELISRPAKEVKRSIIRKKFVRLDAGAYKHLH